jgi:hypothetical protein
VGARYRSTSARIAAPVPARRRTTIATCAAISTPDPTLPTLEPLAADALRTASPPHRETTTASHTPDITVATAANDAAKTIAVGPMTLRATREGIPTGRTSSAEGRYGDLVHAMPAPRQQQNRDVRASDQQEQRSSREERRQYRDVRGTSLLVDEQAQPNTEVARKRVLTASGELLEQRLQFRFGRQSRLLP